MKLLRRFICAYDLAGRGRCEICGEQVEGRDSFVLLQLLKSVRDSFCHKWEEESINFSFESAQQWFRIGVDRHVLGVGSCKGSYRDERDLRTMGLSGLFAALRGIDQLNYEIPGLWKEARGGSPGKASSACRD